MSERQYEPENPRPNWDAERMNAILKTMDYQPTWCLKLLLEGRKAAGLNR